MDEIKQQRAIEEACGWKLEPACLQAKPYWRRVGTGEIRSEEQGPPDYLNDLNAMHEAEDSIFNMPEHSGALERYLRGLKARFGQDEWGFAEASERLEELLKAIGRWEEAKP